MWRRNTWFHNEMGEKQAEFKTCRTVPPIATGTGAASRRGMVQRNAGQHGYGTGNSQRMDDLL
jgi:hypothetical protein